MTMEDDLFAERLRRFKHNENPEAVLLVADDPEFTKIIVAWTNLEVRPAERLTHLPGETESEVWEWLWANISYCLDGLAERSCLAAPLVERKLKPLIGNRVLYPDGTVNSFVQRYLRERVLKLFDSKPRKPSKST